MIDPKLYFQALSRQGLLFFKGPSFIEVQTSTNYQNDTGWPTFSLQKIK